MTLFSKPWPMQHCAHVYDYNVNRTLLANPLSGILAEYLEDHAEVHELSIVDCNTVSIILDVGGYCHIVKITATIQE